VGQFHGHLGCLKENCYPYVAEGGESYLQLNILRLGALATAIKDGITDINDVILPETNLFDIHNFQVLKPITVQSGHKRNHSYINQASDSTYYNSYTNESSNSPYFNIDQHENNTRQFATVQDFFNHIKDANPNGIHNHLFDTYCSNIVEEGFEVIDLKTIDDWGTYGVIKKGHMAQIKRFVSLL
jgi:hypothetical protein